MEGAKRDLDLCLVELAPIQDFKAGRESIIAGLDEELLEAERELRKL